jgi:heme-degrading monooxygenase HmoA
MEGAMLARCWSGRTPADKAEDYLRYLEATGVRDYRNTPGNQGVYVLRRLKGDEAEFLLISLWESEAAIRAFAGDAMEKARYYPGDSDFLLNFAPTVDHYQVLVQP